MGREVIAGHAGVLALSAATGSLSGIAMPLEFGLRGCVLGLSLSVGLVAANWTGRRRLDSGEAPHPVPVAGWGTIFGLLGGLLAGAIPAAEPYPRLEGLGPRWVPVFPALIGAAYGLACHSVYWLRWQSPGCLWPLAWRMSLAGLVCGAFRAAATFSVEESAGELGGIEIIAMPLLSLSGAWFALLWLWSAALLDPAWSHPAWRRS